LTGSLPGAFETAVWVAPHESVWAEVSDFMGMAPGTADQRWLPRPPVRPPAGPSVSLR
jgi:hypothetical protein